MKFIIFYFDSSVSRYLPVINPFSGSPEIVSLRLLAYLRSHRPFSIISYPYRFSLTS